MELKINTYLGFLKLRMHSRSLPSLWNHSSTSFPKFPYAKPIENKKIEKTLETACMSRSMAKMEDGNKLIPPSTRTTKNPQVRGLALVRIAKRRGWGVCLPAQRRKRRKKEGEQWWFHAIWLRNENGDEPGELPIGCCCK